MALTRRLGTILLALSIALGAGLAPASAATVKRQAIINEIVRKGTKATLKLDYVEFRECQVPEGDTSCDTDMVIVNDNPKIRTFVTTAKTKIMLLKNAGAFFSATMQQLVDGRKGKDLGWLFTKDQPFDITVDETKGQIVEIRQIYFP